MGVNHDLAYDLLLARRDRAGLTLTGALENYYLNALKAAEGELQDAGIVLTDSLQDTMLLVDVTNWNLSSRDKAAGMPEWLRLKRRERWLKEGRGADDP